MQLVTGPRTLKGELQFLIVIVGTAFLAVTTILLYQNGQASLRRRLANSALTAAETAAALVRVEDHRSIRSPADMNGAGFREIVTDLAALRRANPSLYHLFTLAPAGQLGGWGVVVDMGGIGAARFPGSLERGRLPVGAPPPESVPEHMIHQAMSAPVAEVLDLADPERARVVSVAPIRGDQGESVGLAVVEISAAELVQEARLMAYVVAGIFLVGLLGSAVLGSAVSRRVSRPLEELLEFVGEVAKGNLSVRIRSSGRNEIGMLTEAFNSMARNLEASQDRNYQYQARLRDLHRVGSAAAAALELPRMMELAAAGVRTICGGSEAFAGATLDGETSIRNWAHSGSGAVDRSGWVVPRDALERVVGTETRLLARAELPLAGLQCLADRPGEFVLVAPVRVSDHTVGALLVLGDREEFQADAVSLASLFAIQVSAAVTNARVLDQVRSLDRSKSEFLSIASHEVRTPLTVIKSSLDILVHTPQFTYTTDQRQLIAFCQESVERLIRLVKDILDISKIEAGVLSVQILPTSLNELVEKCLFWIPQLPGGQGIEVEARLPSEPAMVYADGGRITQVLENLVSNAIKFSKPGGKVTIELAAREREYEVIVSDQGRGISPEDLDRIFGRFIQVEESWTREQGGTGLGLAICKGIVDAHKGRIWAESTPGVGSRFHFTLTRALDAPVTRPEDAEISVGEVLASIRPPTVASGARSRGLPSASG